MNIMVNILKKETERARIEKLCRTWLAAAARNVDTEKESVYSAYRWAYNRLSGLAQGFLVLYQFELYAIADYYQDVASHKMYH